MSLYCPLAHLGTTRRPSLAARSSATQTTDDFEQSRLAVLLEHVAIRSLGDRPSAILGAAVPRIGKHLGAFPTR